MASQKTLKILVGIIVLSVFITNCLVNKGIIEPTHTIILPTSLGSEIFTAIESTKTITIRDLATISTKPYTPTLTNTEGVIESVFPIDTIDRHNATLANNSKLTPTLDRQVLENNWRDIMIAPICSLPCWWDIRPGISSWYDTQELLKRLAIYPDSYFLPENSVSHHSSFDFYELRVYNELQLIEKNEVIKSILIKVEGLRNPSGFREVWEKYKPELILKEFGSPSRILLQTWKNYPQPKDPTNKFYDLSLFYDSFGFVMIYSGKIVNKPNYTICPTFSGNLIEEIHIYIQSPTNQDPWVDLIGEQGGPQESAYLLQEASGLTIQQFYNLIMKKQNNSCFDTNVDIWPK